MNYEILAMVDLSALAGLLMMTADQLYPLPPALNHSLYLGMAVLAITALCLCYDSSPAIHALWRTHLPAETPWWLTFVAPVPVSLMAPFVVTIKLIDFNQKRE